MEKFREKFLSNLSIKHYSDFSLVYKTFLTFDKEFRESNVPIWILFLIIFINGLLNVFFSLFNPLPYTTPLPTLFSFNVDFINKTITFISGIVFIYLSFQVLNNKITAWYILFFILIISAFTHLIRINSWYSVLIPILGLIILFITKKKFVVKFERNTIENNFIIIILIIIISSLYGILGFFLLSPQNLGIRVSLIDSFLNTILALLFLNTNSFNSLTAFGSWFLFSLHLMSVFLLLFIAHALFRPLYYIYKVQPDELSQAEVILQMHGNSSLDYFKLWPDKSLFFSKSGFSFLSYKVKFSTAICLGDPSGPKDDIENILIEFESFCKVNGWKFAYHHVKPDFLAIYKKSGFSFFKIGEEATVQLPTFVENTSKHTEFKRSMNKFTKEGYYLEVKTPPHDSILLEELKEISDEWLSTGRRERGFTLGNFNYKYLQENQIILLKDKNNKIIAFLNRIKSFIPNEATIDLMRHKKDIPNGAMDFLFESYLKILYYEGVKTFSLGLSPFAGINESVDSPFIEKAMEELFDHFNKLFSFKGLRHYKEKFEPTWDDRYFTYKGNYITFIKIVLAFIRISEK